MNAKDYIKKYGETAFNMLPDEIKKQIGGQDKAPENQMPQTGYGGGPGYGYEQGRASYGHPGDYGKQIGGQDQARHTPENQMPQIGYGAQPGYGGQEQGRAPSPQGYSDNYSTPVQSYVPPTHSSSAGSLSSGGNLLLAAEEKILKSYHASHVSSPKCEGYLTITNERVIFRGDAGDSFIMDEIKVDTVSGFSSFMGSRFITSRIVIGLCLLLVGFMQIQMSRGFFGGTPMYGMIAIAIGIVLLIKSRKKIFSLKIYSGQATGSPIDIGEGFSGGVIGGSAVYAIIGDPTPETRTMLLELGAIFRDLQTLDEESVFKKWS